MRLISQLSSQIRSFVLQPAKESKRTYRYMRYWVMFGWFCTRELKRDNATQMAAALTYRTMFSLLPMLVLALVLLQAFRGLEHYQHQFKQSVITFLLPEELLKRDSKTGEFIADSEFMGPPTALQILEQTESQKQVQIKTDKDESVADARALVGDNIEKFLDQLQEIDFGKIGWVGFLVFIYGATTLLETAEKSFNAVFDVEQGRVWYLRMPNYVTMILLGPIAIITGQVIQQRLMNMIEEGAWTNWLAGPMMVIAPVVATWLLFFAMFTLLPHTKVKIRAAAFGSFVAAIFWVGSKELFSIYATRTGSTSLYGALALVPLFLLWVYLTWLIVLFGLEVAYTSQMMKSHQFLREVKQTRQLTMVQSTSMLNMLCIIKNAFDKGTVVSSEELMDRMGLTSRLTRQMITELEKAKYIHRVQSPDELLAGYSLAQPPQAICVADVLELSNQLAQAPQQPDMPVLPGKDYLQQLVGLQIKHAIDHTLADIV